MRLREPDIAGLTQGKGTHALGQRPFHPSPGRIGGLEGSRRLALPGGLEGLMLRLWAELHRPRPCFGLGTAGAHRAHGTMGRVELDGDPFLALVLVVSGGRPPTTMMPLRTRDRLGRPINGQTRHINALWTAGLPARVGQHRPHEVYDRREAAVHEVGRIDIACIQEVFTWEYPVRSEMGMNDRRHLDVCGRGRRRFDIDDEMGAVRITGLGEVDCIPRPVRLPLRRIAGVNIVRGADQQCMGGQIFAGAPADLGRWRVILLQPDPA